MGAAVEVGQPRDVHVVPAPVVGAAVHLGRGVNQGTDVAVVPGIVSLQTELVVTVSTRDSYIYSPVLEDQHVLGARVGGGQPQREVVGL